MARSSLLLLPLLLLLFASSLPVALARAKLYINMLSYINHDSYGSDGLYCDTFMNIFKLNDCDPMFTLYVDSATDGGRNLFDYTTDSYENQNSVYFGGTFGSLGNPLVLQMQDSYPGYVKFTVHVRDHDLDAHDHMDSFYSQLNVASNSGKKQLTLWHKEHSLKVEFWLTCDSWYYGPKCSTYCRPQNDASGHYTCGASGEKICLDGWVQPLGGCQQLHPCRTNPCKNGGTCVQEGEGHSCVCSRDYGGSSCEIFKHPCEYRNPCSNGATCFLDDSQQPDCNCSQQFRGPFCRYDVNECDSSPCRNGRPCVNSFGNFSCDCGAKFAGRLCELDVDECEAADNPCSNGANCSNVHGDFRCSCPSGWRGRFCELDVDECLEDPCRNGANCSNTNGSFVCSCSIEFTGSRCQLHKCNGTDCDNGGSCTVGANGLAACSCAKGFEGDRCQTNVDDCASSPCRYGDCVDRVADFECRCLPGFAGRRCEQNVDDCSPNPCRNGGNCTDGVQSFSCHCQPPFVGERCQRRLDVDDCVGVSCENGGTCEDLQFNWRCRCASGFAGSRCELKATTTSGQPSVAAFKGEGPSRVPVAVGSSLAAVLLLLLLAAAVAVFLLLRRRRTKQPMLHVKPGSRDSAVVAEASAFDNPVYEEMGRTAGQQEDDEIPPPPPPRQQEQLQQKQQQQDQPGRYHNPVYDNNEPSESLYARFGDFPDDQLEQQQEQQQLEQQQEQQQDLAADEEAGCYSNPVAEAEEIADYEPYGHVSLA